MRRRWQFLPTLASIASRHASARIRLAAAAGGLISATAITLTAFLGAPAAQAAPLAPVSGTITHASFRPATIARVTITVRCGKFVGVIDHGGIGGIFDPAHLAVRGKLTSSCNSTTYLQIKWNVGFTDHAAIIKKAGPRKTVAVDWQILSRNGSFAHIGGRLATTDGMPRGKVFWGKWKNV